MLEYFMMIQVVHHCFYFAENYSFTIYLLQKQLQEGLKALLDKGATGTALVPTGLGGAIASALYLVLTLAIRIAYYALILVLIINLAKQLFDYFISMCTINVLFHGPY